MDEIKLKPCRKCIAICRLVTVRTASDKYRIGCVIHGEWQKKAYSTIEEAENAWNRSRR